MNTAVFALVNAVLLRQLPYPDSNRLVWIAPHQERDAPRRTRNHSWRCEWCRLHTSGRWALVRERWPSPEEALDVMVVNETFARVASGGDPIGRRIGGSFLNGTETAVRIAVGAQPAAVVFMIARQAIAYVLGGVVAGVAVAIAAGRTMGSMLYGVEPSDPLTLATVAVGVALAACAACWLPAIKAARVDPAIVLRQE